MVTDCKYGRKGKGGRHTRWLHSGEPVSTTCVKKRKRRKEKNMNWPVKNKREKRGNSVFPPEWASLFSLFLLWFFPLFFSRCLFHLFLIPVSLVFFLLCLIILSSSVSLRHVFQSLPSIDTVSTNSSPPVPRGKPPGKAKSWGKACWVWGDTGDKTERYRAFLHDNHCSSI